MNIKTRHKVDSKAEMPCLMISKESSTIVLARRYGDFTLTVFSGIVLDPGSSEYELGYDSDTWDSSEFTVFQGELILSND